MCFVHFGFIPAKGITFQDFRISRYYVQASASFFSAPLKFKVATVPKSGLPPEFKYHGLRNLPAIIHGEEVRNLICQS